jgi:cold shock CspA family protein
MNKFAIIAVLISFLVAGGAFAAEAKAKASTGTVVSYTAADTAKGTAAVLVVKVGKKDESFVIDAKTVVQAKGKKALDIATLKAGDKVDVKFTEDAKKVMTAVSVTLK